MLFAGKASFNDWIRKDMSLVKHKRPFKYNGWKKKLKILKNKWPVTSIQNSFCALILIIILIIISSWNKQEAITGLFDCSFLNDLNTEGRPCFFVEWLSAKYLIQKTENVQQKKFFFSFEIFLREKMNLIPLLSNRMLALRSALPEPLAFESIDDSKVKVNAYGVSEHG